MMEGDMVKLTARIDPDVFNKVMYPLRYGQQTALLQTFMECLGQVLDNEGLSPIVLFIAKQGPLTLDPTKLED